MINLNFLKTSCPNCKKHSWRQITQVESKNWYSFAETIMFCPHCHREVRETKSSKRIRLYFAIFQLLFITSIIFVDGFHSSVIHLFRLHSVASIFILIFVFMTPVALIKYEVGEKEYKKVS